MDEEEIVDNPQGNPFWRQAATQKPAGVAAPAQQHQHQAAATAACSLQSAAHTQEKQTQTLSSDTVPEPPIGRGYDQ